MLLQFFPDSGNLIVAAADSGLTGQPDWYLNLKAHPQAHAEVKGSTVDVRAEAPQKPPRARDLPFGAGAASSTAIG